MNAKNATTSSDAISVSANGAAPILNHKVQVNSLSTSAYLISTNKMTRYFAEENSTNADQTSINMADVLFQGLQTKKSDGKNMANVHETDGTASGLFSMNDTAFSMQVSGDGKNYKTIKYTYKQLIDGRTFNDFVSDINALGINVRASYDSVNDTFSFYNKKGGSENGVYFKIPTATTTDDDGNSVTSYTTAGERAKNFLQNMHLYQSIDGQLYGQGDTTTAVTDTSTDKTYFGYESTYTSASMVASTVLTDNQGNEAAGNSKMMDVLFGSYTYESVEINSDSDSPQYVYRYDYNDFDYDCSDSAYQYSAYETDTALSFTINYGDESFDFEYTFSDLDDNNMTIDDILSSIETRTGLTASLSDDGYLSISTEEAGSNQSFSITANDDLGITSKFFNRLSKFQFLPFCTIR